MAGFRFNDKTGLMEGDGLSLTGSFQLQAAPVIGRVLTSDGTGNGTWQTAAGALAAEIAAASASVQTTDATPTLLFTRTLNPSSDAIYRVQVTCKEIGDTFQSGFIRTVLVWRAAGTAQIGTVQSDYTNDASGLNCTFVASGNDIQVMVTGLALTTIDWVGSFSETALGGTAPASVVYTNTTLLQAGGVSFEDFTHNLNNQFPHVTTVFKPGSGTYVGQWINGESVMTVVYLDVNTIRIYNASGTDIAIGDIKVTVGR